MSGSLISPHLALNRFITLLSNVLLLSALPCHLFAATPEHPVSSEYASDEMRSVEGTGYANLDDAYEILMRISSLSYDGHNFSVIGKGVADIYVDGRKLSSHSDLIRIPASSVRNVEILSEPRPEYGNKDAVVIIFLKEHEKDVFNLSDILSLSFSPLPGGGNDLVIDGRKGKFQYEGGLSILYTGTVDNEKRFCDTYAPQAPGGGMSLDERILKTFDESNRDLTFDANIQLGYRISDEHKLTFRYEYEYSRNWRDWNDLEFARFSRHDGVIDLDNPDERYKSAFVERSHTNYNGVYLGYSGKVNDWSIQSNIDFYFAKNSNDNSLEEWRIPKNTSTTPSSDIMERYRMQECSMRTDVSHPLWKGKFGFGVSFDDYFQNTFVDDKVIVGDLIDNNNYDMIPGIYASLMQDFSFIKLDVGLHYQTLIYKYTPLSDDQTKEIIEQKTGKSYIRHIDHFFHPHLTLNFPIGDDAELSTGIQSTTQFPLFKSIRINVDRLEKDDYSKALAFPERQDEFFLNGKWKWVELKGWTTHHFRPIFRSIENDSDFNGKDYYSMDWRLSLSPSVAFWESDFSVVLHKQWLDMPVVDAQDNLKNPRAVVNWTNSFTMPWGMRLDIRTDLATKGADRNLYYRQTSWNINLSLQQKFLKDHLTVTLSARNLAHRHCENVAFYMSEFDRELDCNIRALHTSVNLSLRYNL